uniref:Glycerate kinase n=1 Tax=Trichuris muris TaxID=70415 RepID=A0A5S6R1D8_TRIMR
MAKSESTFDRDISALLRIFRFACDSVDPKSLVKSCLSVKGHPNRLAVSSGREYELNHNVYVVAFGKAALSMCRGATSALGTHIVRGIASVPVGAVARSVKLKQFLSDRIAVYEGAYNNLPDQAAFETSQLVVDMVQTLTAGDILLVLISGGGSALLPYPIAGISLTDKQHIVDMLSRKSASIFELNVVRHHLSILKGGGLLTMAPLPQIVALIISDVMSNDIQFVASGPTVNCTSTPMDAIDILKRYCRAEEVPKNVWSLLANPTLSKQPPANPSRICNLIIGDNLMALRSASEEAVRIGFTSFIISRTVSGEASTVGKLFSGLLHDLLSKAVANVLFLREGHQALLGDCSNETLCDVLEALKKNRPICLLWGGETTVKVRGNGLGGRNQELVLSFIHETLKRGELLTEWTGENRYFAFASLGTDGQDGPTDAAGAFFHSSQLGNVSLKDVNAYLANNDSYNYFKSHLNGSCLVKVGLTETNVMDLILLTLHR